MLATFAVFAVVSLGAGGCSVLKPDDLGSAVLTVVDLGADVEGWRLRAEARSDELDGSPTFYFSASELVEGSTMTSEEIPLGARSYTLVIELAEPSSQQVRRCEAELVISGGESLDVTVEADSISAPPSQPPSGCALTIERGSSAE